MTHRSRAIVLVALGLAASGCSEKAVHAPLTDAGPSYVGRQVCASCHARENDLWQGSHHDLAMQVATESTVLGDFDGSELTHFGVTSTFFRRDGKFFARTEGPDGELADYEITHTFGVVPLQQYLVAFPGGRYQVLSTCWDSRP